MRIRKPRTLIGYLIFVYAIFVVIAVIAFINYSRSVLGLDKHEKVQDYAYEEPTEEPQIDLEEVLSDFENNVINTNIDNVKIVKEYECLNGDTIYRIENSSEERVAARDIKLCFYSLDTKKYIEVETWPKKIFLQPNSFSYLYVYNEKGSIEDGYTLEKCELYEYDEYNFLVDAAEVKDIQRDDVNEILITTLENKKDTPLTGTEIIVLFFKGDSPVGVTYGLTKNKIKSEGSQKLFIPYPIDYENEKAIHDFDSYKVFCLYSTY